MNSIKKRMQEGFTLVEILIVVVIIGILATIAIPAYFRYVERGYASDAKVQIKNIAQSAEIFYQENQDWPADCWEEMNAQGYLDIKTSTTKKWEFDCNWPDVEGGLLSGGTITATSLPDMAGGEGKSLTFNWEEGTYSGYGQKDQGQ